MNIICERCGGYKYCEGDPDGGYIVEPKMCMCFPDKQPKTFNQSGQDFHDAWMEIMHIFIESWTPVLTPVLMWLDGLTSKWWSR